MLRDKIANLIYEDAYYHGHTIKPEDFNKVADSILALIAGEGELLSDEEHEKIIIEVAKREHEEMYLFHTKPNHYNKAIAQTQLLKCKAHEVLALEKQKQEYERRQKVLLEQIEILEEAEGIK